MADDVLKGLLYALHDAVMLLAPAGWSAVELRFAPGGTELAELQTKGEGARAPAPKPDLGVDPKLEAHRLSEGVAELSHLLERGGDHPGRSWTPGRVVVERTGELADWKLLRDDGSTAWFMRLSRPELDTLLITDAMFAAVHGTERAFRDLQASLDAKLAGASGWRFDGQQLTVELRGAPVGLRVELVGRYLAGSFTWAWGWADASLRDEVVAGTRAICAPSARPAGLSAFWRERFQCDEGFAWALASHVAVSLGARGLYRAELADGSAVLFAVLPPPPNAS